LFPVEGNLPSDDLLSDVANFFKVPGIPCPVPERVAIPPGVRSVLQQAIDPIASAQTELGILPILEQAIDIFEQIPLLIEEVSYLSHKSRRPDWNA